MCLFRFAPPGARSLFAGMFLVVLLGGCGGGSSYMVDTGDLAQRFLPTTREVDNHPDSLEALSVREEDGKFQFEFENDYKALHYKWSSSYQSLGTGRSRRQARSYATLWSLELSLASLQPEFGITTLSKDQARDLLDQRRTEYREALQIDVYWFESEGNSLLTGPGARAELRIKDSTYTPVKESHGPLREAYLAGGNAALYRRNTFHFARTVGDTDILDGVEEVTLVVDRIGSRNRARFSWSWKDAQAQAHLSPRNRAPHIREHGEPTPGLPASLNAPF